MFLSEKELRLVWSIQPTKILHVGAHTGEEHSVYTKLNAVKTIWVEAQPGLSENLSKYYQEDISQEVICAAVWSSNNVVMELNISNNAESSSLLEMKLHSELYPKISQISSIKIRTRTLDSIISADDVIDFINIDIQGAELEALKGAPRILEQVKWLYLEVNELELYEDCPLISDIDEFLELQGFKRVVKRMWLNHGWGDALYIRNDLVAKMNFQKIFWKLYFDIKWKLISEIRMFLRPLN
jgi:FkbM family methyltransferase